MKNETNIYDIDGNIIRKAGDNHKMTIDEVEKLVDDLVERVKNSPDNEVYKVYLNNAQKYLYSMYNSMSKEDIAKRLTSLQSVIDAAKEDEAKREETHLEELNNIMDEFKAQYDNKPSEEYVDFEEVKE